MVGKTLALAVCWLLAPLTLALPDSNRGTVVNLRIEGDTTTIFEGRIFTRGHDVETASGGEHHCDGTNLGANPAPGPTATSALDDAAKREGFDWDGNYFSQFDDYLVSTVDGVTQTTNEFWGLFVNYKFAEVGGCQQRVEFRDEVLWAFGAFDEPLLKLSGAHLVHVGQPVTLTVTDGRNGTPVAGAEVQGETSDADGRVVVTFNTARRKEFKAEKANALRSSRFQIVVVP
ncbi:hypothetical protein LshimejAT787_0805990 [Lyophyllum shimeji]|uniref:Transcobalamin-like C-terminal domain-containing protein n=1 Tax=Lyophyllum shimeji TaxID=47721 RepID=A0A9P3PSE8_LYOSH|nr:hypothetical protein LshimejAT787_0805990 [Lyophyllum shimeji]